MSLYFDFVQTTLKRNFKNELYESGDPVLEAIAEYYNDGEVIMNTIHMTTFVKLMCAHHRQKIGGVTIAGHGSSDSFRIGLDSISMDTLQPVSAYPEKRHIRPALISIKPFFETGAWIRIDACECGLDPTFLKAFASLMGVTVLAWTGQQIWSSSGVFSGPSVSRQGKQVVCTSRMCVTT